MARYRKGNKINSGGFGIVYLATRVEDDEKVAFKELAGSDLTDADRKRFAREVRIQSQLEHPNIVPVLGYNLEKDPPFFVMPLAKSNLRAELRSIVGDVEKVRAIYVQLLDGVEHAHENGVIHRDLKPENILFFDDLFDEFWIRVGDFGLGKRLDYESITITRTFEAIGTAAYAPPEQFNDLKSVDCRGDIYSLGKILYELLSGELPIHVDVTHPSISPGYRFLISKCLEHNPENRYPTVKELKADFTLLTASPEKFEQPGSKVEQILEQVLAEENDDPKGVKKLDGLFQAHIDDESFILKLLPKLPSRAIRKYYRLRKHQFDELMRTFEKFLPESLPFEYTDTVADFYERVFRIATDSGVRRLVLSRLMRMGFSHNRFHVGSVVARILSGIKSEDDALLAIEVIRQNPEAAGWCAQDCNSADLFPVVKDALDECHV